jgi:hypothetical protein
MSRRHAAQTELFPVSPGTASSPQGGDEAASEADERLAMLRERLRALLDTVTTAERLPFRDATAALIAELEFGHGVRELPRAEAEPMHRAFNDAMWRLYAIAEGMVPPPPRPEWWVRLPLDDDVRPRG